VTELVFFSWANIHSSQPLALETWMGRRALSDCVADVLICPAVTNSVLIKEMP